jgi:hypothetical protein
VMEDIKKRKVKSWKKAAKDRRYDMMWYIYNVMWCDMVLYDVIYDVMWYIQRDVMWYDVIWYYMIYDTICDMIWYDDTIWSKKTESQKLEADS